MKRFSPLVVALTIVALFTGCGGGSGVRFSDLFDESAAAEGTGIQGLGLVRAVVILATHEATPRQRQIAEQNGRRAVARLEARAEASAPTPSKKKKKLRKKSVAATSKPKPKPTPAAKTASTKAKPAPAVVPEPEYEEVVEPTPAPKPKKKLPRIIAIATEKDAKTDRKAAKAIMLYDTHAQKVIGNKVYDIESEPRAGDEVRFETYSTSYIGASL